MRLLALILAGLAFAAPASAMQLGVQDDGRPAGALTDGQEFGATWVRIITIPGDPSGAERIRAAHAAGFQVVLTVGGIGTRAPILSAAALLSTIRRLPRAERYTVLNEVDLLNLPVCRYRAIWMRLRRSLGRRLLWGDYSPFSVQRYLLAARVCGKLPQPLDVAVHPYQRGDPLQAGPSDGSLGSLQGTARQLRAYGMRVRWVVDEFAYLYHTMDGNEFSVTDEQAAYMWPRALLAAERAGSPFLIVYMASGATWDSRPRQLAWAALSGATPAPVQLPVDSPWPGE